MTSSEYWRRREAAQREKNIRDEAEYAKELRRIYEDMMDSVQKEIDAFYARYAAKEGITLAAAKRRADKLDIEAYERKAKKYVREKNFSKQANDEMRLYNLVMKVNRLELLKANIGLELVGGFDEMQKFFAEKLTDRTLSEFRRQAGILGESVQNNAAMAHAIVNASFHNATFSDRIWMYQDILKGELAKQLQIGLIQGKGSRDLARNIRKRFDVSRTDAERLMVTELRRVQTGAAKLSYQTNGNEEYQFLALNPEVNSVICNECRKLDGKHFKVSDMKPGENAPPMHPRCHCATAPYWDEEKFQRWLEEVNRRMHERDTANGTAVANSGGFVILNDSNLKRTRVTGESIGAVPLVKPADWTDEAAEKLQAAHKELLRSVSEYDVGTEVGVVCDLGMVPIQKVVGADGHIDIPSCKKEHIVIHNHPSCEIFSESDLLSFLSRSELNAMTAVGNDGRVYVIRKTNLFDGFEMRRRLVYARSALKQFVSAGDADGYVAEIRKFLKEAQSYGVEFIERRANRV